MKRIMPRQLLLLLSMLLLGGSIAIAQPDDRGPRDTPPGKDRPTDQQLTDEQKEQIEALNERFHNAVSDIKQRIERLHALMRQQLADGDEEGAAETREEIAELHERLAEMKEAYREALREILGTPDHDGDGDRDDDGDHDEDGDHDDDGDHDEDGDHDRDRDRDRDGEGEGDHDRDDLRDKRPCPEARAIMERLRNARMFSPEERAQLKALQERFRASQEVKFAELRELQQAYREAIADGDEEAAARIHARIQALHESLRAAHERFRNAASALVGEDRREEIEALRERLREVLKDCGKGPRDGEGDSDRRRGRDHGAEFAPQDLPSIQ